MDATRYLIVIADDYGIGPETSRGILDLTAAGVVRAVVLLVNSPYAEEAVRAWRQGGTPGQLGWHPCLTMDPPAAGAKNVPTLVGPNGQMWPLGQFVARLAVGLIRTNEIERELSAQYDRFVDLTGHAPDLVNSHQHVALFPPVGAVLRAILERRRPLPYLRRVREPGSMLAGIPGARVKRTVLTLLGRLQASGLDHAGFPGADWFAGTTDPQWVKDPDFFARWLRRVPGRVVELACHPGRWDDTLVGRDCHAGDGLQQRRVDELHLLWQPNIAEACRRAGFVCVSPMEWAARGNRRLRRAA